MVSFSQHFLIASIFVKNMKSSKLILIGILFSVFSVAKAQVLDSTLNSINKLYALWEKGYAQSKEQLKLSRFNSSIGSVQDSD